MSIYWLLQIVLLRKWACRYNFKLVLLLHLNVFPQVKLLDHQFSLSVMSNSLWPHGLQQARLSCPTLGSRASSDSCPSSRWCHPAISSSVIPLSCLYSLSGSFPISQFFASNGQSIGVSALASVLPMNIQDWFPLGCTGQISLQSKRLSRVFSNTTVQKHQFFGTQLSL